VPGMGGCAWMTLGLDDCVDDCVDEGWMRVRTAQPDRR
jgi:hypothetical protein